MDYHIDSHSFSNDYRSTIAFNTSWYVPLCGNGHPSVIVCLQLPLMQGVVTCRALCYSATVMIQYKSCITRVMFSVLWGTPFSI